MINLTRIHSDIDARVQDIRQDRPDWLCAKGCDSCCRSLADVPQLTFMEWELLRAGLMALPPERFQDVRNNIAALSSRNAGPLVCPMLDETSGACPVYNQRPVVCRTYGFYVQRELGLYCGKIESRVAVGELIDVVWGNHDAIDQRLTSLGVVRSLSEWFEDWIGKV